MRLLFALFLASNPAQASEVAHANFINDLVDTFRKPFQEKLLQIGTNYFFERNLENTHIRFFSDEASVCADVVNTDARLLVSEIRMNVSQRPAQSYQHIEYSGCDRSRVLFSEYMLIKGPQVPTANLTTLFKRNLDMTLADDETEKSFFMEYKGVRLFQIVSKRTSPSEYLTRFEIASAPMITIYTKTFRNRVRLTLRAHSFKHQYFASSDYYQMDYNGGGYLDFNAELVEKNSLVKYFDHSMKPISKKAFDEAYKEHFVDPIAGTVGAYYGSFKRTFPITEAVVDTRGSTEFLNNLKEAYQLLLNGQTLNAQNILEELISDIESGKTQVTEKTE